MYTTHCVAYQMLIASSLLIQKYLQDVIHKIRDDKKIQTYSYIAVKMWCEVCNVCSFRFLDAKHGESTSM